MTPGYEADMRRIIGRDVTCRTYARGVIVSLPCTGGHTIEHQMEKMLPPDALKRQLANRGWKLGKRLTCPDHQKREKPDMPEAAQPAVVTPAAGMTPDARKVHRAVMEALMSVYDDDGKRYTSGYTDQKVAEETGAAVEYVRKTREEFFGPVAIPPEFTALRGELDALTASIAATRRDMATVRQNGEAKIAELEEQAKGIKHRLDNAAKTNGWAS